VAVTARTLRLQRQINRDLTKITDAHTRALVAAWADAWDEIAPDLTAVLLDMLTAGDRVTRGQLLRSQRLRNALAVVAARLEELAAAVGVLIIGDLQRVIDEAGGAQASVIDSQLPPQSALLNGLDSWSRVDTRQIDAIVARSTQQITSRLRPLSADAYDAVRRELLRGVAAGSNPRATALRIIARTERGFNGGLARALTIARTETLDAHRAAAHLACQEHADVLKGWRWYTALDANTCPACIGMAGSFHQVDEPGPEGHPNCRCVAIPVVKAWAELGVDHVEEPPDLFPDAQAWFDDLGEGEQRRILGPARYAAYRAGGYPMKGWAHRRSNTGWRDSYQVSPLPNQRTGRRVA